MKGTGQGKKIKRSLAKVVRVGGGCGNGVVGVVGYKLCVCAVSVYVDHLKRCKISEHPL